LADPGRLVDIGRTVRGEDFDTVSYPTYLNVRDRATSLSGIYALELEPRAMSLGGRGEAERVYGALVSGNYFSVLGTTPELGRTLHAADDEAGGRQVVVISRDLWERRFESDTALVGQTIILNGRPFGVVGVAPRGFQGTTLLKPDLWIPISNVGLVRDNAELLTSPVQMADSGVAGTHSGTAGAAFP
jgi:hypothetical protein